MSLCDECRNRGGLICSVCCSYMGFPDQFEPKPKTRGDLIRSMGDSALAAYLEEEIGDSLPVDWLAWLREELSP